MRIIDFLRLIQKNIFILIAIPILLASIVTYLTRNPTYKYSSETTLYTGIASGSSIEVDKSLSFFATNTAFDNLINIIKSRKTHQEVAIRLLAQHLMLSKPDPRFISEKSFNELKIITPGYVRQLVSSSGNPLKIDKTPIIKESLPHDTALHLAENDTLRSFSFSDLDSSQYIKTIPPTIDKAAYERTVQNLQNYMESSDTNFVYKLLYFSNPHYSIKAISSVSAQRISSSDLVKLKYESDDPGICQQTLSLLTDVCIKNYRSTNENRSDAVVKYFEHQLKQASRGLKQKEEKLLKFNEDNKIINFYEQSKAIAVIKEELDNEYNKKKILLAGNQAAIKSIEEKLGVQSQIQLKSANIIEKRNKLADINYQIAAAEALGLNKKIDAEQLAQLKLESDKLKLEIRESVSDFYNFNNNPDGLPVSKLLNDWLTNVIEFEDTKAGIEVLAERIKEFQKQYAVYAPAGANLKRIEREISVSEQEFLEILHGLNLAKLKVQDAELSSTIRAIDPPFYPLSPNPTKRKLLIMLAAVVGFMLVLSTILATEYFDDTLKNLTKAEKKQQIKTIGALPKIQKNTGITDFSLLTNRLFDLAIQLIEMLTKDKPNATAPKTLLFFSTTSQEGKTTIAGNIALNLKKRGKKILFISFIPESAGLANNKKQDEKILSDTPRANWLANIGKGLFSPGKNKIDTSSEILDDPQEYLDETEYFTYPTNNEYDSLTAISDFVKNKLNIRPDSFHYIIVEIPSVLQYSYPSSLFSTCDQAIMVCRANRVWSKADQNMLDTVKKLVSREPVTILNGVELPVIESLLGDLPKKRSFLRRAIKNLVRLQFNYRIKP